MVLFIALQATFLNTMKVNGDHVCQARFTISNYISCCSTSLNKSILWHHTTQWWVLILLFFKLNIPWSPFSVHGKEQKQQQQNLGPLFGIAWRWENNDRILISECCLYGLLMLYSISLLRNKKHFKPAICWSYRWSPSPVILVF